MTDDSDRSIDHPGTNGIWTFIFIDMIIFLLMFMVYLSERHRLPDVFAAGQQQLNPLVGLASALFLLTSSWCMVEAVQAARATNRLKAEQLLTLALLLGGLFVANKIVEYSGKVAHGITPATNSFYTFYFVITGLHFVHVIGGMCFMLHCRMRARTEMGELRYRKKIENVGLFWHFVDILWLFIFPMLYLAGAR